MANDTRGVFRLRSLRQENVEGKGVNVDDVWVPHAPTNLTDYGYWTEGRLASGYTSTTERTTFTTDTTETLPSSPHPTADYVGQSLTSLTDFYTAGGWDAQTRVYKMSYSNESWSLNPGSQNMVREQRESGTGVGPKTAGYIFMGDDPNYHGAQHSSVQKVVYSVDVWSQLPNFPYAATYGLSFGNQTKAIVGGGNKPSVTSQAYKFTYATETYGGEQYLVPNNSGPGSGERSETASTGNAELAWVALGRMPHGMTSTMFKYTFATDTAAATNNKLSRSRRWPKAAGNTSAGYFAGGDSPAPTYTTMDKLNFSTDTGTYTPGANLSVGRSRFFGSSPRMNGLGASTSPGIPPYRWSDNWQGTYDAGYYAGGTAPWSNSTSQTSTVYKTNFVHDTTESLSKLPSVTAGLAAVFNTNTVGYISGGAYNQTPNTNGDGNGIMKYSLVTETASQLATGSSRRLRGNNDMGIASSLAGYAGGGYDEAIPWPYGTQSISRKFTFSTESETLLPGAAWTSSPSPVTRAGSVGNSTTHGYFAGGTTGAPSQPNDGKSDIVKFTYSTDSISTIPANLRASASFFATSSDANTGYFYGGDANPSGGRHNYIDKMVFSTDTRSNAPNNLAGSTSYMNGTGNSSNAFIGGGYAGSSNYYSYVQKYNLSTETMVTIPSAAFPLPKYGGGAMGPLETGGTSIGAPEPTPTPEKMFDAGGAGASPNYGYTSGGTKTGGGYLADTIRIPFQTDSRSTVPSAGPARTRGMSISSGLANYMVGGETTTDYPGAGLANYWKYTYSTTTNEMTPAQIPNSGSGGSPSRYKLRQSGTASAGAYAGYLSGGFYPAVPGQVSTSSKLDYSNESASLVPASNSPYAATYIVGMGRANDQSVYMAGGDNDGGVGRVSYVSKISHVTDTASNALYLPSPSSHSVGTESLINGYFGMGQMPNAGGGASTQMFKLTYSSETMARIPSGDSTGGPTSGKMAMASTNHGYFTGGSTTPSGSYTEKLQFSNDTMAGAPGAGLNYGVSQGMAFSPKENGIGIYAPQFNPVNL